jgi:3-methyladenine DNA glycosylase AlkD
MARYAIPSDKAFGASVGSLQKLAKTLGRSHALAGALWESGWYEARMLAAFVDEPERVTSAQMDRWCRDFDNWGICDTVCFHLFDRTPFAWDKAVQWAASPRELVKRGGFVLMACLALHDKTAPDKHFLVWLPVIENGAGDQRNFVKKGVSWALRAIGRRNLALNEASVAVARRLAQSEEPAARWVGKDALRELTRPNIRTALARRAKEKKRQSP